MHRHISKLWPKLAETPCIRATFFFSLVTQVRTPCGGKFRRTHKSTFRSPRIYQNIVLHCFILTFSTAGRICFALLSWCFHGKVFNTIWRCFPFSPRSWYHLVGVFRVRVRELCSIEIRADPGDSANKRTAFFFSKRHHIMPSSEVIA